MLERRAVHTLVLGDAGTVLLADARRLPEQVVDLGDTETTIAAVRRAVLPALGHRGPILDCFIVQPDEGADPSVAISVLVELATPPAGWVPPDRTHWAPVAALDIDLRWGFADLLAEIIDVRLGHRPPDPLRPEWTSSGWFEQASAWVAATLERAGLGAPTHIVQHRHWGMSALMHVMTADRKYWFKAVFPHFRHEVSLTAMLDQLMPGSVAGVVGFDADRGWMLVEHVERDPDTRVDETNHREEVATLVALQRRFADAAGRRQLLNAGCARRPLAELPDSFARAAGEPLLADWYDADSERVAEIVAWLRNAVADIEAVGVPDTLVHGDFHPNNIIPSGGRHTIIDWSDGAVSNPLLDTAAWMWWLRGRPDQIDALWRSFEAAWAGEPWVEPMRALRPVFDGVAAAYHFVSYAGIVVGLDRHRRREHADGLAGFFAVVDAAARSDAHPA